MARSKRRADGSLRPTVARARQRRQRTRRRAWLAEFDPGVRRAFFTAADLEHAKYARPVARETNRTDAEAEVLLEQIAVRLGWLTLRTRSGRVVGIAPRKR